MAVLAVLELGNPMLRQRAQPVADPLNPEIQALIADLWDTLDDLRRRRGRGHALAASVVGIPQRVMVVSFEEQRYVLINPRFERWSRRQSLGFETCLTFDCIYGQVYRPEEVVVVAIDAQGLEQRYEISGRLARIMQHEIDHLDGLVWLDRDPDLTTICTTNEYLRQRDETSGAT